ncbi:hypothetical protein Aab01nite_52480 [Paractinoplanes abujensis]|uniref:Uncharacterized protein n=1 Tax=Paractinoplanes abujensis TaxID=882441 RepID=A0A7W7G313_9ACTN|nr:hypothetical protein [Actinoplanes abujensis]MBB4693685.1 hypothetical protein [Actinoplanes abujensis]GID21658.1 hypothetical protein Aab01nite_52480 [Actinoplanes abujensis]
MSDPLTPLFDDLRTRTLPQVQPPGTEAARRTVHRRATVRASVVAAVVIAAGGAFIIDQRNDYQNTIVPASSASPSASGMLWRGRADKVEVAAALVPGASHADVMDAFDQDVGIEATEGRYRLRVGCSGPTELPFTILLNGTVDQQSSVDCTDAGEAREYELTMPRAGSVRIVFSSIGQFDAYALKLTKI